jgi:hypothetical protein
LDKKYLGKNIALPQATHDALVKIQEELTEKLGFEPSLTETVAYLIKNYNSDTRR